MAAREVFLHGSETDDAALDGGEDRTNLRLRDR